MLSTELVYYLLSFVSTYTGYRILETAHNRQIVPTQIFMAILGWVGAVHYWHQHTSGLSQVAWYGFLFLGISPLLAYVLNTFLDGIMRAFLFFLTFVVIGCGGIFLFPQSALDGLALWSLVCSLVLHFPYRKIARWFRERRLLRDRLAQEEQDAQKRQEDEQENLRQKQIERDLYEKLVRDLAK